ncbi:MAG: 1-(5-phosphoribosyl)-5-[(5-phosphoribosylamino)methylideneamino]imidazole-4-carboxamide isomerase [Gammaproteobacteria bacterium]|nr:1-(5-phosphoribosyl)-5-[(5-phosphoribosylamino)methylideneamino]imidazole-4-carboxamide isomerase [Gammaproteobacteria bacterium]
MLLIPAIDLKDGRCVRLRQGRMDDVTVFSDDPVAMARRWADAGCRRLHLVDLDGAVAGVPRNEGVIRAITTAMGTVPVQVGGGIRDLDTTARYLDAGVAAVIIGTKAVQDPEFLRQACDRFGEHILLGLDARGEEIATHGWESGSGRGLTEFAQWAAALDLGGIVYTDIARDGMLTGLNVQGTVELAQRCGVPVIASGGVANLADLEALARAARDSSGVLLGAITGRAVYEGTLDFRAGQQLLDALA